MQPGGHAHPPCACARDRSGGSRHGVQGVERLARSVVRWRAGSRGPAAQRGRHARALGRVQGVPALVIALNDEEPLVRGHAGWVLERIGTEAARHALRGREEVEEDAWVREEMATTLGEAWRLLVSSFSR
ncbi:MAG TPA: HEAT repeat domain-containing protein [Longimicrobium sp.]|nr:HEAT repeat domain-containing protein [Longimicrobium sp.]